MGSEGLGLDILNAFHGLWVYRDHPQLSVPSYLVNGCGWGYGLRIVIFQNKGMLTSKMFTVPKTLLALEGTLSPGPTNSKMSKHHKIQKIKMIINKETIHTPLLGSKAIHTQPLHFFPSLISSSSDHSPVLTWPHTSQSLPVPPGFPVGVLYVRSSFPHLPHPEDHLEPL